MKGDVIDVLGEKSVFHVTEDNRAECRSCGAPIIWCITSKGKKMPVDEPDDDEPTTSHFATCPERDQWRKS